MSSALLSSPDPLNDTPTFQSPVRPRRSSRARHSFPLQGSSPTKQTFELDVGNNLSPQKLRVTVEAGNSDMENTYSNVDEIGHAPPSPVRKPINRRRERTTTITIPVKGLSDSEEEQNVVTPKQGRGRPKKSATPVPAKSRGRASTPTQKLKGKGKRKSIGDLVDGDDEEDFDFHIGKGVEVGRGKGRSRSRSTKSTSRKLASAAKQVESSETLVSGTTSKNGRSRRKTLLPDEVVVLEDERNVGDGNEEETPLAEMSGALSRADSNAVSPISAFSTIRSTTTIGGDEPDITIARFHPGQETPRLVGWSSPRVVDAPHTSESQQKYPSPSPSPHKTPGWSEEDSVAMISVSPRNPETEIDRQQKAVNDPGEGDELGELREFDTILESEGFSMISVDSVPSFRDQLSSPLSNQEKKSLNPIKNRNILATQEIEVGKDDSFSSIPADILEAATPARKLQNQSFLAVQNAVVDNSFSSIPPDILEAATPARKPKLSKIQEIRKSRIENSFSSIVPELSETGTPSREPSLASSVSKATKPREAYEDSFSAIPSAILEAATPGIQRQALSNLSNVTQAGSTSDKVEIPAPSQTVASAQRNDRSLTSTRLPTPEETPSPAANQAAEAISGNPPTSSAEAFTEQTRGHESSVHSQIRSSPPSIAPRRYTYTAHLRQRRQLHPDETRTPSIVFSSPSLPPPIQVVRGNPVSGLGLEQEQRPALSPTVRAGRVLQGIVVPSSPRSRAQSLGSPFKSPIVERRSSSSVAHDTISAPHERGGKPLPRIDLAGNLFPCFPQPKRGTSNNIVHHDDPFSMKSPSQQRSPSPDEKQAYSLEIPEKRRLSNPRLSNIRSEGNSIHSDDAMSWQAEEEVPINDATTSLVNHINSSAGARGSSLGVDVSHPSAEDSTKIWEQKWAAERSAVSNQIRNANDSQVIVIDSDDEALSGEVDDEEDFELLVETLNSSSPIAPPRPDKPKCDNVGKPRRSKIPSPWRKNSKRLAYSDELSHLSSPGLLLRAPLTKNQDAMNVDVDLSTFVIPQKSNFKPRLRERSNLEALLAPSPSKVPLPVLSKSVQNTRSLLSGSSSDSALRAQKDSGEISNETKEPFTPIPQKLGFKPVVRDPRDLDSSLASSPVKQASYGIFGRPGNRSSLFQPPTPEPSSSINPGPRPLGNSSSSKTNSLPPISHQPLTTPIQSSFCSHDSPSSLLNSDEENEKENENKIIDKRTLKWTETVRLASAQVQDFASPTKSCLRSPLKTPSAGSGSGQSASPTKTVAFVSSSPMPSSPTQESLSSTTWSRGHWLLLDSILQSWKPEKQAEGAEKRRRNSTRVISKLLGKNVKAQGEKMKLQQWHLEVVDEFRGHVPGWQEDVIAKRVFALIIGEERRALGLVGGEKKEVEQDD